jgi:ESX secretion system ATPase EccB
MSTNPTTKAQVQAYRFVLRRMESALVRKDAVMLHEPMRHHLRATAVGLILGLLGLAAFFVVGKFTRPATPAPSATCPRWST